MLLQNNCPVCGQQISSDRIVSGSAVCSCGWTDDKAEQVRDAGIEKRTIMAFMAFGVVVVLGFGHLLSWGGHALTIPFLKAGQMTGMISRGGLESIVQACFDRSKWGCVEETYGQLYAKTTDIQVLSQLAHFQSRLGKKEQAAATYESYVRSGGNDPEALFRYATLVEEAGTNNTLAIELFAKSVAASTDRLPVRAMGSLIRLFMKEERYQEAFDHLTAFHKSSGNALNYYVSEMKTLTETVKQGKKIAKQ